MRSIVDGAYRVGSKSKFRAVRNRGVEVLRYGQAIKASKVFWDVPDIASRVGNPLCVLSALDSFSSGVQLGRVARLLRTSDWYSCRGNVIRVSRQRIE